LKYFFKNFWEKLIEGILLLSGTITSITVILITFFLFKEGFTVFSEKPIEAGYAVVINKSNSVRKLSGLEIKDIYDQKITSWKALGAGNDSIILIRFEDVANYFTEEQIGGNFEGLPTCINKLVDSLPGIIAFFPDKYIGKDFTGQRLEIDDVSFKAFFGGEEWFPTAQPVAQLGVKPLIYGTLWVSFGAILFALPLGLAAAIFLSEIASARTRRFLKPLIELLAGIPSVVYGFFGLVIIVPLIQKTFNVSVGETGLAGCIILGIMALPTIITISEDAMRNTPRAMKEASLALGASKWQTIYKIVIPYSISGISAGAILGIGRAIGETMAVLMVTGNAAIIPHTLLEPMRTIPATIAAELGEAPAGGLHYKSLFALGCILFIITMVINITVAFVSKQKTGKKH
jgi:phosphate transport system permease protein